MKNLLWTVDQTIRFIPRAAKIALQPGNGGMGAFVRKVTQFSVTALALSGAFALDTWERWQK